MKPFPEHPPADLGHASLIRDADWSSFRALTDLVSHWHDPARAHDKRAYWWLVDYGRDRTVHHLVARCQRITTHPAVDPVPLSGLHLALGRAGFTDEVRADTVLRLADAAAEICSGITAFDLEVGPLSGSTDALRLSVTPWTPLFDLHSHLCTVADARAGRVARLDTRSFRPHINIAYVNRPLPSAPLLSSILRARSLPPVFTQVNAVMLVEMRRENHAYRCEVLRHLPLR